MKTVTEYFGYHYNQERPHQGRTCGNQPPAVAQPVLPTRPALPTMVDPDRWLEALDGRWYPRVVKADGRIRVDKRYYYIRQDLAGHHVMLYLNAATRSFDVFRGERLPLEAYIDLMRGQARSEERQRLQRLRQARLQRLRQARFQA